MLVNSLKHLKKLAVNENGDFQDFYISIANGIARSSKRILYEYKNDEFSLIHEVDESYQEFNPSEIKEKSNLIEAINRKALFKDID